MTYITVLLEWMQMYLEKLKKKCFNLFDSKIDTETLFKQ